MYRNTAFLDLLGDVGCFCSYNRDGNRAASPTKDVATRLLRDDWSISLVEFISTDPESTNVPGNYRLGVHCAELNGNTPSIMIL